MAASLTLTEAQVELISSLPQDDIPAKLRCAICSKLAVNAFRLPCCEQAICENCQSTLPSSCPVCEHSPLSADDCKPHKALRTTIKVFLRTEEKKRESSKPKDVPTTPITPVGPSPISATLPVISESALAATEAVGEQHISTAEQAAATEAPVEQEGEETGRGEEGDGLAEQVRDDSDQTPRNGAAGEPEAGSTTDLVLLRRDSELVESGNTEAKEGEENIDNEANPEDSGAIQADGMGGTFPANGFAPGFDQMQMMMAMQNGFGNFPMMGMPGMNMDPMTMQMYMSGGFQGMGMNGMNMNMGMGGYGGEADNWNGQQSWNVGQDNYNHPSASGMGNGDYGSFNSGFQTGFNQGNYGHQNQFNDYRRNQYGFRGRGRGRGYGYGYNRGGYQHGYGGGGGGGNWNDQNYEGQQYQNAQQGADQGGQGGGQGGGEATPGGANVDEFGRALRDDAGQEGGGEPEQGQGEGAKDTANQGTNGAGEGGESVPSAPNPDVPLNAPKGPKAMMQGLPNTSFRHLRARGWVDDQKPPTPTSATGTGFDRDRSRSNSVQGSHRGRYANERHPDRDRSGERDHGGRDRHRERERDRDRGRDRERSSSRSRSRSHRRSKPQRSYSAAGDEERESGDERRHHRSSHRRKDSTYGAEERESKSRRAADEPQQDGRSRSASPLPDDAHRRSSHRSSRKERDSDKRRDRDRDRDRDRERDKDRDEHRRKSHRSQRDRDHDRDRERDRDRDRDREKDRDRHRDRDRDRDRERDRDRDRDRKDRHRDRDRDRDRDRESRRDRDKDRHHRSAKPTDDNPPTEPTSTNDDFNPPAAPRSSNAAATTPTPTLEIKGLATSTAPSDRRTSLTPTTTTSTTAALDPHAAERMARDRERLLRETRRMASLTGFAAAGSKRSRDGGSGSNGNGVGGQEDVDGGDRRKSSRRKGRRGEVIGGGDRDHNGGGGDGMGEEERVRRGEEEREKARYE